MYIISMSLILKNIILNGKKRDIRIAGCRFQKIAPKIETAAGDEVIDGSGKAVFPGFYNLHTHAAMSLLKGIGDDKELFSWLSQDIWPREAKFDADIIYAGTKLAVLEMVKSGTVFFSDMYFEQAAIMKAVAECGIRAAVSIVGFDMFDPEQTKQKIAATEAFLELFNPCPERISKTLSIHSVYTVSEELIRYMAKTAEAYALPLHIHASETRKEVEDCQKEHGCSPIAYLEKLGALGPRTMLAHAVWLDDKDIDIILKNEVKLITNPSSNFKLASGMFQFGKLKKAGCKIGIGTDGSASNNSLSMFDEMKLCALSAKIQSNTPTAGKAEDIFAAATSSGAQIFGFEGGEIAEGKLADCMIIDLNNPLMFPDYNLISNLVYGADSSVVDTVICHGRIIMNNRRIPGEAEIMALVRAALKRFN